MENLDNLAKTKRKSLSKKIRFEVFKRDKFKCHYCGASAPDTILHIDHINPVFEGGNNDLLNLITACVSCNLGKGKKTLSDDSMIVKARTQLDDLQEKQEQLTMMIEWQKGLQRIDENTIDELNDFWSELTGYRWNEIGKQKIRELLRKFSLSEVMEAMSISANAYLKYDENQEATEESALLANSKIGGVCFVSKRRKENPEIDEIYKIRAMAKRRCNYFDDRLAFILIEKAHRLGADLNYLKELVINLRNWTSFKEDIENLIVELEEKNSTV